MDKQMVDARLLAELEDEYLRARLIARQAYEEYVSVLSTADPRTDKAHAAFRRWLDAQHEVLRVRSVLFTRRFPTTEGT